MDAVEQENQLLGYADPTSQIDTGLVQFDPLHSDNIKLQKDSTLAIRQDEKLGILFSKQTLAPGEIFIMECNAKLMGTKNEFLPVPMFVGLTPDKPNSVSGLTENDYLVTAGPPFYEHQSNILGKAEHVRTPRGLIPRNMLIPTVETSVRVGIIYVPKESDANQANLHMIVNGIDTGPKLKDAFYLCKEPLFATIYFFGTITEIRIIQSQGVSTLENACRSVIREQFDINGINQMTIPKCIKRFLTATDY